MHKSGNITMKRGVIALDNESRAWFDAVTLNRIERRDVTVSLLDENQQPVMVWKLKSAWPVKFVASNLKAEGNEVAIETIELVHDGLSIQDD